MGLDDLHDLFDDDVDDDDDDEYFFLGPTDTVDLRVPLNSSEMNMFIDSSCSYLTSSATMRSAFSRGCYTGTTVSST